jgi:dsDNA-binding SOS-regulon protein
MTTQGRGFTPEEVADRALDKLLYISDSADPMVKAQAMVFKEQVRQVLVFYMNESIKSYKTTLCAELTKQGHGDIAQIVTTV